MRIKYSTIEFSKQDIHLRTLRDTQEFNDKDDIAKNLGIDPSTWSLFGVLWPSGEVLARFIASIDVTDIRILEVGCGIGLPSHVLNSMNADISATDHHPMAGNFMDKNTKLNDRPLIPFFRSDWEEEENSEMGEFDLIIGSDLLYQPDHVGQLAAFLNRHAKEHCDIILADPGRGNLSKFKKAMEQFGFSNSNRLIPDDASTDWPLKGKITSFTR